MNLGQGLKNSFLKIKLSAKISRKQHSIDIYLLLDSRTVEITTFHSSLLKLFLFFFFLSFYPTVSGNSSIGNLTLREIGLGVGTLYFSLIRIQAPLGLRFSLSISFRLNKSTHTRIGFHKLRARCLYSLHIYIIFIKSNILFSANKIFTNTNWENKLKKVLF